MTRKEELKQRAITIVEEFPVYFETETEKKEYQEYVFDMLLKVEREVWEKAITILDGGRFLADSSMERTWADNVIKVLRAQQQELI